MVAEKAKQLSLTKTTGQSFLSLLFNLGGILAGAIVATSLGLLSSEPWIVALYPGVLSVRGVIGGLFCGRMSTGLHLGTIPARLFGENTKRFYLLWGSIIVLTFESSIILGLIALFFGAAFLGMGFFSAVTIFGVLIATMAISIVAISPLTIVIAFSSFKRGLDPDVVVYPIESTMADVLVTLCYILVLYTLFFVQAGWIAVLAICIVFIGVVLFIFYKNEKEPEFVRTIKEAFYIMLIVAFIVNITGSVLSRISSIVGSRPAVYVVYPALIDTMGDVGAIVGSTATTKLALGAIDSSFKSIRSHRNQIAGAWIASAMLFLIYALISSFSQPINVFFMLRLILLLLGTNFLAGIIMILISFGVALLTYKRGLDPDNFVIPIESSLADTITTVSLLVLLSLIGGF